LLSGESEKSKRFHPRNVRTFYPQILRKSHFQARDFDRNRVAIVGVRRFGSQNCGLIVVLSCDFEQKQARSIKFCVKNSVRHIGFRTWA
jgi:hypothetical protein